MNIPLAFLVVAYVLLGSSVAHTLERNQGDQCALNLLRHQNDFRHNVIPLATIKALVDSNQVLLIKGYGSFSNNEYSAIEWTNVSAALKTLGLLDRKPLTPQIRVIQQNAIIQSDLYYNGEGYDKGFLTWPLSAGDVIVLSPTPDY